MVARNQPARRFILCVLIFHVLALHGTAWALPSGGQVAGGTASIEQSATKLTIQQQSPNALLNWQGFSIGQRETVQFLQPSATSLAVNRVLGGDPSVILGNLLANGRVFLLNPNGVVFGAGSVVNVGGLLATTLSLKSYDLDKGQFTFAQDPTKALAAVVNQGTLGATDHGFVVLTAPGVVNEGLIVAKFGHVGLGAGTQLAVDFRGDGRIQYAVDGKVMEQVTDPSGRPLAGAITNAGRIEADGGTVLLTAKASSEVLASVINQTGIIQARRLESQGGEIVLKGGDEGIVRVAGVLDARGEMSEKSEKGQVGNGQGAIGEKGETGEKSEKGEKQAIGNGQWAIGEKSEKGETSEKGERGGTIDVRGEKIGLTETAKLDVSGEAGGGTITVGGGFQGKDGVPNAQQTVVWPGAILRADATTQGDGGTVIVWADGRTQFGGEISARGGPLGGNGGFAEVSGKENLIYRGTVDLRAPLGNAGTLLLDPKFIVISPSGAAYTPPYGFSDNSSSTVTILDTGAGSLSAALNGATVTLQANTDITFQGSVVPANAAHVTGSTCCPTLTLNAGRSIIFEQNSSLSLPTMSATINADAAVPADRDPGTAQFVMNSGAQIISNAAGSANFIQAGSFGGAVLGEVRIGNGSGPASIQASSGAGLRIDGVGNPGILIDSGSSLEARFIILNGSGGPAGGTGVRITNSTIQARTDSLTIGGEGTGTGAGNVGIELLDGAVVRNDSTAPSILSGFGADTSPGIRTSSSGASNVIQAPTIQILAGTTNGADSIVLANLEIRPSQNLQLSSQQGTASVGLAGGVGQFNLSAAELDLIQPGVGQIIISGGDITVGTSIGPAGYTFKDSVTISGGPFIASPITINGPLATTGTNSLTLSTLGLLTVNSTGSLMTGSGALTLNVGSLALNGASDSISGTGTLTLTPSNSLFASIGLGNGAAGTFNLTSTELQTLKDGFSSITVGDVTSGSYAIEIKGATFRDPVTIGKAATIAVNGPLTGTGNASITLIGSGATTTLNSDIITAGQPIIIQDSVIVAGGGSATRTLDTTNGGGTVAGANVMVTGTVKAQTSGSGNESLTVNAGTAGDVLLQGEIGGSGLPLANLTVANAHDVVLPKTTVTSALTQTTGTGTTTLNNTVTANTIDLTSQTLGYQGAMVVGAGGDVTMKFTQMVFLADVTLPDTDMVLDGPVTVMGGARVFDVGLGALTAKSTVNAQTFNLTLRGNSLHLLGGAGSVTGAGTNSLELAPGTTSTSMGIAGGAGTLQLTTTDLAAVGTGANGFATVKLGRADSTGAVTVGSYSSSLPLLIQANGPGSQGSIVVTGTLATSTPGDSLTLLASQNITLSPGASVTTNNGPLTLTANAAGTAPANSVGIEVNGATVSSGTGALTVSGTGGSGSGGGNVGVRLQGGSSVSSTSGPMTITGYGGSGSGIGNRGVEVLGPGTLVSSTTGIIDLHGTGGANSSFSYGVVLAQGQARSGGHISLTGQGGAGGPANVATLGMLITNASQIEGTGSATVSITGTGGTGTATSATNGEVGVFMHGQNGTFIRTANGDLIINGTGNGTGIGGQGVILRAGALVESTGAGNVSVTGIGSLTGSANSNGIQMIEANTTVRSNAGNLTMNGTAHGTLNSTNNIGAAIASGALVQKTGTGGTVSVNGTGGDGGGGMNNFGLALLSAPTQILANDGTIVITGTGGTGGASGVTAQGGFAVGAPGIPCGSCAPSPNINAGAGGTITITSTP